MTNTPTNTGKTYEMLWSCEYCGAKKLLGKTHRHCPECGAAQDPARRYFPSDDEKVAVEDHVFVGSDVHCPTCKAPMSAAAKHCAECGAALTGGAEVARIADSGDAGKDPKRPAKRRSRKGLVVGLVFAGLGVLSILFIVLALWTEEKQLTTIGHTWQREIKIEVFGPKAESAWCDSMPGDAYSVSRSREVRSYNSVKTGESCSTRRVDNGDGTFTEKRECTPEYRQEPVYGDKCNYTVDRWGYSRSATASGRSLAETPAWPQFVLRAAGTSVGSEREGQRIDTYTVHFADGADAAKTRTCGLPEANWRAIPIGSQWRADAYVLTGELDCATLKAAGAR
jgi:hypothetical protein